MTNVEKFPVNESPTEDSESSFDEEYADEEDEEDDDEEGRIDQKNNNKAIGSEDRLIRSSELDADPNSARTKNSFKFRAQKHFVGRMVTNRHALKPLVGRAAYKALKLFEQLLKLHIKPERDSKQVFQALIKTVAKIGVVIKNQQLTEEQLVFARAAKQQLRTIALTVISFVRTEYTYDRVFLNHLLLECQQTLRRCVSDILSENSNNRIVYVFTKLRDPTVLDSIFDPMASSEKKVILDKFVTELNVIVARK